MGIMLAALAILLAGSLVCLFAGRDDAAVSRLGAISSAIAAVMAAFCAGAVLVSGTEVSLRLPWPVPLGSFYVAMDPLSAFFILTIALVCALAAIYGASYLESHRGRKNLGAAWFFFNILFASMLLVVISRNGILFLVAWELMSLSSFFLVMFEHEKAEVREAGWVYLVAAHVGQICLMFLFMLLGDGKSNLDFDQFTAPVGAAAGGALFILAVAGFGAKAGFLPLHVWLPDAHPAAPSHVSAVMSGVMIKMGIYGLVRIVSMLGNPPAWWGWSLLGIGALSGIAGILFALAQRDIKRLLAYCSVENVGIITMGLGLWLLGASLNHPALAALALMGALLHVLNHSIYKSLLFFGAGAVAHATGTRDMDRLGGLQKSMPGTAAMVAIGAAAICGLPPFNGFISEFLMYLGVFGVLATPGSAGGALAGGLIALAAMVMMGGLAAACFTKLFGMVFLGVSRSPGASESHEAPKPMLFAMTVLAGLCVALGLFGPLSVRLVMPVGRELLGDAQVADASTTACSLLWKIGLASGVLILITGFFWMLRRRLLAGRTNATGPTWDCGYAAPSPRMQYTASSFSWPVIAMFKPAIRPRLHADIDKDIFPRHARLASRTDDFFREAMYAPLFRAVSRLARRMYVLQEGRNQLYVLYIAITILVLLLVKAR